MFDVAIIGSGFTGALGAGILSKLGYKVLLLERGRHPKFALGESSTPLTTHYLKKFSDQYGIPEFDVLSSYEKMKSGTNLNCGPKELFYYMGHSFSEASMLGSNLTQKEVIVQTRSTDVQYDRAQLDEYLTSVAIKYGSEYIDMVDVNKVLFSSSDVTIFASEEGCEREFKSKFIIDCTGHKSVLAKQMDLRIFEKNLDTPLKTRTIFTHFKGVKEIDMAFQNLEGFDKKIEIPRTRGTQHHVFDGGWYWFIPFDNGVTSVGISLDMDLHPQNAMAAEEEFMLITSKLPLVKKLLSSAQNTMAFIKTDRLQFFSNKMAGGRWALMPSAAFGIDAWQSTGMTLSVMSLDRLIWNLENVVFKFDKFEPESFAIYQEQLSKEFYYISRFIHGVYKSFKHQELFNLFCLLPFLGIEKFVLDGGLLRPWDSNAIFMNFGNPHWVECFNKLYYFILDMNKKDTLTENDISFAQNVIQKDMYRYNSRNYGCPSMKNTYMVDNSTIEEALDKVLALEYA